MDQSRLVKRTQKVLIALTVLVGIMVLALLGVYVYRHFFAPAANQTIKLPDNIIENAQIEDESVTSADLGVYPIVVPVPYLYLNPFATRIQLYKNNLTSNDPFDVRNMFPGDTEVKNFAVRVHHKGRINLYFTVKERESTGTARLASVLEVQITNLMTGAVVYTGLMDDLIGQVFTTKLPLRLLRTTDVYYQVSVHLPTKTGNPYQRTSFSCDFIWTIDEKYLDAGVGLLGGLGILPCPCKLGELCWGPDGRICCEGDCDCGDGCDCPCCKCNEEPDITDPGDPGEPINPPPTGDTFDVSLYVAMVVFPALLLLLLFATRRRRGEDEVTNEH